MNLVGPDAIILFCECWVLSQLFHSHLTPSSRDSISSSSLKKKSSSSLSATRVVSSAYMRLLIFLPTILIPTCDSSSPAFHMIYSAYKLNKQGEPVCCSMSSSVASWPAYRFLKRQVRWSSIFPSLEEFSTVYCDPHSQKVWHSQ